MGLSKGALRTANTGWWGDGGRHLCSHMVPSGSDISKTTFYPAAIKSPQFRSKPCPLPNGLPFPLVSTALLSGQRART